MDQDYGHIHADTKYIIMAQQSINKGLEFSDKAGVGEVISDM